VGYFMNLGLVLSAVIVAWDSMSDSPLPPYFTYWFVCVCIFFFLDYGLNVNGYQHLYFASGCKH
jgi:hypothetical protein